MGVAYIWYCTSVRPACQVGFSMIRRPCQPFRRPKGSSVYQWRRACGSMKAQGYQGALLFFIANLGRCYLGQVDMLQCYLVFTLQSAVDVLRQP
jgi:hypothetical protein